MQKGSALIPLTLFLAVLALAGISGWYYFNSQEKPQEVIPVVKSSPSLKPQINTYEDPLLGIKLTIPEGYEVVQESESEYFKRANGDTRRNFTYYVQYPPAEFIGSVYILKAGERDLDNAALSVLAFKNPDNLTAQEIYNRYWYYPFVWGEFSSGEKAKVAPKNIELISGKEGYSAIVKYRDSAPKFIYLPLKGEGIIYQIHLSTENNKDGEDVLKSLVIE